MFGAPPSHKYIAPLEKGDHPELDTSNLLGPDQTKTYQSLIGSLQWAITLGRFDIMTAVVTLSAFRAAPCKGHLEHVKCVCGYLSKMRNGAIRVCTDEPDFSDVPVREFDWSRTTYGAIEYQRESTREMIPLLVSLQSLLPLHGYLHILLLQDPNL
jgi:hypothetical protein